MVQVERRANEVRTPGEPFPGVRRLIVVRDDRLGDLLLSLPAVDALRRTYPEARLALLVRPELATLARRVGGVDEVVEGASDRRALRRRIEDYGPDLIVCISRGATVPLVAARAGVPHRVGAGYRAYSPLFTRSVAERRRRGGRHEAEYALSFAHRAGDWPADANFPLSVSSTAREPVTSWLEASQVDAPFVVLHPGSGGSCPRWPTANFIELAEELLGEGGQVVFSIGPEDDACVASLDGAPPSVARLPRFSSDLRRLPALFERATLLVASSTGPLHLAAAIGTPTLGLYAPWSSCAAARWGPYAQNGWVLEATCAEALRWSRTERRRRGEALLGGIAPRVVAKCVESMVRGDPPAVRGADSGR